MKHRLPAPIPVDLSVGQVVALTPLFDRTIYDILMAIGSLIGATVLEWPALYDVTGASGATSAGMVQAGAAGRIPLGSVASGTVQARIGDSPIGLIGSAMIAHSGQAYDAAGPVGSAAAGMVQPVEAGSASGTIGTGAVQTTANESPVGGIANGVVQRNERAYD